MASTHSKTVKAKSTSVENLNCDAPLWVGACEVIPPGFVRLSYFKKKWGLKDRQCRQRLFNLIDAGKVITKKFYIKRRDGKPDFITHYKEV